ncbi:MAG: NAD(P)/FAD-dependent oxidoreductase [Desulfobacterales bacterium]
MMVWPYRESIHYIQDHCLRLDGGKVPNLKKRFREYHVNITSKLPWWADEVAPRSKVRARMWEGFEIYVGLDPDLRNMKNHDDGILLIGDAAGLESTELCDGVPAAWFSADIAADVAIEALRAGNTKKEFLQTYDDRIRAHSVIQWSISGDNRYNLRYAQETKDIRLLRKFVHNAWGMGQLTHSMSPVLALAFRFIRKDPGIITQWLRMYFRYYQNWLHNTYDYQGRSERCFDPENRPVIGEAVFKVLVRGLDFVLWILGPLIKILAIVGEKLAFLANPVMKIIIPVIRPIYKLLRKPLAPIGNRLADRIVDFTDRANPALFEAGQPKQTTAPVQHTREA